MFRSMTMAKKLILGFATILVLLVIVGVLSYFTIEGASTGFASYREKAIRANRMGEMQAAMLMGRMQVRNYLITHHDDEQKSFQKYLQATDTILKEMLSSVRDPERLATLNASNSDIAAYAKAFEDVVSQTREADRLDTEVLAVVGREIERRMTTIMEEANQQEVIQLSATTLRHLLLARIYVRGFAHKNDQESVERVNREWSDFEQGLDKLAILMQDPQRRAIRDEIVRLKDAYKTAFERLVQLTKQRNQIVTETIDMLGPKFAEDIEKVKLSYKKNRMHWGRKCRMPMIAAFS